MGNEEGIAEIERILETLGNQLGYRQRRKLRKSLGEKYLEVVEAIDPKEVATHIVSRLEAALGMLPDLDPTQMQQEYNEMLQDAINGALAKKVEEVVDSLSQEPVDAVVVYDIHPRYRYSAKGYEQFREQFYGFINEKAEDITGLKLDHSELGIQAIFKEPRTVRDLSKELRANGELITADGINYLIYDGIASLLVAQKLCDDHDGHVVWVRTNTGRGDKEFKVVPLSLPYPTKE